jgi:pyruvate,water dikinase
MHEVFASLYNDRAIAYRVHQGFDHADVALSAGVQLMVRSDLGASGVMFTLDTESGFRDVVFVTASYGLGETVVQGAVNPDEFYVYKPALRAGKPAILRRNLGSKAIKMVYGEPGSGERVRTVDVPAAERARFCLTDAEVDRARAQALVIEQHYGRPMDIEWGKDGSDGKLYILQARPRRCRAEPAAPSSATRSSSARRGARRGPQPSASASAPARARDPRRLAEMARVQPATCWSPT